MTECKGGILSLAAQQLTLAGQATGNTTYQMYASNSSAQATNTCNVSLLNSQARSRLVPHCLVCRTAGHLAAADRLLGSSSCRPPSPCKHLNAVSISGH